MKNTVINNNPCEVVPYFVLLWVALQKRNRAAMVFPDVVSMMIKSKIYYTSRLYGVKSQLRS